MLRWDAHTDEPLGNPDLLTYADNLDNLAPLAGDKRPPGQYQRWVTANYAASERV